MTEYNFSVMPFYGKCQNLQASLFTCVIFARVPPVLTQVTQIQTQIHTETDKAMAIGEIADLPKYNNKDL